MATEASVDEHDTASLLRRCSVGDAVAYDAMFAAIYDDLHGRARLLARGAGATLSATVLVHEAYLKLSGGKLALNDKAHFFALAARAMRQVLLNGARDRAAHKRGGGQAAATLDSALAIADGGIDVIALDQALQRLSAADARMAQVVDLHFFAGLGFAEIGELLGVTERTIARDWRAARALLQLQLGAASAGG